MQPYTQHRCGVGRLACLCGAAIVAVSANAQNFPERPLRFVTAEAGGAVDVAARILAAGVTPLLGQQVIIDNRPSGIIPGDIVAHAKPDGYTLLVYGGVFWLQPYVRKNVPYDPIRDFTPISIVAISPTLLVVHPALPVKSVKDLIALAKARPAELNYAMGSVGSANHLAAELFKSMAGIDMLGIGYRGNGPAVNALIGGQVQLMFATASSVIPLMKSGRVRALAVASLQPSPLVADLPTIAASGLPGYESTSITGFFAPAKTPPTIVSHLHRDSARYLQSTEARERYLAVGAETVGSTPDELAAKMKTETARVLKVIRDAGIRIE